MPGAAGRDLGARSCFREMGCAGSPARFLKRRSVRGMGETTYAQIRQEFERRIGPGSSGKFHRLELRQQFTTPAMERMEREIVGRMQEGNWRDYSDPMLVSPHLRIATEDRHRN